MVKVAKPEKVGVQAMRIPPIGDLRVGRQSKTLPCRETGEVQEAYSTDNCKFNFAIFSMVGGLLVPVECDIHCDDSG